MTVFFLQVKVTCSKFPYTDSNVVFANSSQHSNQQTDVADHDAFELINLAANFIDAICGY